MVRIGDVLINSRYLVAIEYRHEFDSDDAEYFSVVIHTTTSKHTIPCKSEDLCKNMIDVIQGQLPKTV